MGFSLLDIFNPAALKGASKEDIFGRKPVIPDYFTSSDVLSGALGANLGALPEAERLATLTNAANSRSYQANLRANIPGYDEIVSNISGAAVSASRGELPKDVSDQIRRVTAEGAARGGYQGSQVADFAAAQNIGISSLEMMSSFDRWMSKAQSLTTPGFFDITSAFISTNQQMAILEGKDDRNLLKAATEAAPDPVARGLLDLKMETMGMILSAYGGGAGYKGAYQNQNYGSTFSTQYGGGIASGTPAGSAGYMRRFNFSGDGGSGTAYSRDLPLQGGSAGFQEYA